MGLCPPSVAMAAPQTSLKRAHSGSPPIFTNGGKMGAVTVICYFPEYESLSSDSKSCPITLPQYKELYAIYLALKEVKGSLNLFSDSIYAVNLLPWLSRYFIKLYANPLSPLLLQVSTLIQGKRLHHLYPACLISQPPAKVP